jgi:predicted ester cyclase
MGSIVALLIILIVSSDPYLLEIRAGSIRQQNLVATATPQANLCAATASIATLQATSAATQNATEAANPETLSEDQYRTIVCRYYEIVNKNTLDKLPEVVADDVTDHNPIGGQRPGLAGLRQRLSIFRRGFPNLQLAIDSLIVKDSMVVSRVTAQGNLRGLFFRLQTTGQRVTFHAIDMFRIVDGLIVELWHVEDVWSVALGQLPTLTPTPTQLTTATSTPNPTATATMTVVPTTPTPGPANPNPAFIGIQGAPIGDTGVRIVGIFDGSPAVKARLHRGDLILAIDGQPLSALKAPGDSTLADTFFRVISAHQPGDKVTLSIRRANQPMEVEVTLGVRPPGLQSRAAS